MDDLKFVRSDETGLIHIRADTRTLCGMSIAFKWVDVACESVQSAQVCCCCRARYK